jgi:ATP-dependent RNA helicase DeaD
MDNFSTLSLPAPLMAAIEKMNFTEPTPIQAKAIPFALEGRDILGSAQTGTGKTAAFGIPLIAYLMQNQKNSALVMTPTRELALQVVKAIGELCGNQPDIKTALLIGGEPIQRQLQQLQRRPRLLVGTPGRINDHLERGSLMLHNTGFLVLDETDRMLDMGFSIQIERILKFMPAKRQTLLFSATLPADIIKISQKYLNNPERVAVGSSSTPIAKIKQETVHLKEDEKYAQLLKQLDERTGSVIVFVKTKHGADKMAQRLRGEKHRVDAIHGDLRQSRRDRVIEAFRSRRNRILVATDVAARGLDIPHIEHVINYDLPQCPEDYIHRVGRTGRAGAEGSAICFVSPSDRAKWGAINRLINPDAKHENTGGGSYNKPKRNSAKPFIFKKKSRTAGSNSNPSSGSGKRFFGNKRPVNNGSAAA